MMTFISKKVFYVFSLLIFALIFSQCNSSNSTDGDNTTAGAGEETTESAVNGIVTSAVISSGQLTSFDISAPVPALRYATFTTPCIVTGNFTFDFTLGDTSTTMTYSECNSYGITLDGSIDMVWTMNGDDYSGTVTYSSFSIDNGTTEVTTSGTVTMDWVDADSTSTLVFDIDGTVASDTISLTGTLTYEVTDSNTVLNGTLTAGYNDESYTCTFSDFDYSAATDDEWAAVCE